MRYLKLEFRDEWPTDKELVEQVRQAIGQLGLADSQFKIVDGLIACERGWTDRIIAVLSLKWQFKTKKISGTMKKAKKS
ncbi:MAG: hypothetical protein GOU99_02845 [Candidatus Altiarchaeota archaeon]|nr:hypothetical protein [Candidatus Altiarchaeota archaeon]